MASFSRRAASTRDPTIFLRLSHEYIAERPDLRLRAIAVLTLGIMVMDKQYQSRTISPATRVFEHLLVTGRVTERSLRTLSKPYNRQAAARRADALYLVAVCEVDFTQRKPR